MSETAELRNRNLHIEFKSDKKEVGTVKFIRENPNITLDELSMAICKSRRTVARQVKQLQEDGIIRRVGSDKTGHWEIID